jgi:hypothetical protein
LGDLALEKGELDRAGTFFQTLTWLQPDDFAARGKLALVQQLKEDWQAADFQLRHVLEKHPNNVEFMLRLGVLNLERRKKATTAKERNAASADARHWLQAVLRAQPENALASRGLESLKNP